MQTEFTWNLQIGYSRHKSYNPIIFSTKYITPHSITKITKDGYCVSTNSQHDRNIKGAPTISYHYRDLWETVQIQVNILYIVCHEN
jgi:hypothetical protein